MNLSLLFWLFDVLNFYQNSCDLYISDIFLRLWNKNFSLSSLFLETPRCRKWCKFESCFHKSSGGTISFQTNSKPQLFLLITGRYEIFENRAFYVVLYANFYHILDRIIKRIVFRTFWKGLSIKLFCLDVLLSNFAGFYSPSWIKNSLKTLNFELTFHTLWFCFINSTGRFPFLSHDLVSHNLVSKKFSKPNSVFFGEFFGN